MGVVAFALTASALVGPWWVVREDGRFFQETFTSSLEFAPSGWTGTNMIYGGLPNGTYVLLPNRTTTIVDSYAKFARMGSTFLVGSVLAVSGAASGVVMLALAVRSIRKPSLRRSAAAFGIAASVLILAAVGYITLQLPGAADQDLYPSDYYLYGPSPVVSGYWGTGTANAFHVDMVVTYAAGWSWYALVVAAAAFIAAGLALTFWKPEAPPT